MSKALIFALTLSAAALCAMTGAQAQQVTEAEQPAAEQPAEQPAAEQPAEATPAPEKSGKILRAQCAPARPGRVRASRVEMNWLPASSLLTSATWSSSAAPC